MATTFDDEYLEVFGGEPEVFKYISQKIENDFFKPLENKKCDHTNTESFPDNRGYCVDCGINFSNVISHEIVDEVKKCLHQNTFEDENGLYICRDCNNELEIMSFEPEWRYYGSSDNQLTKDPARCHRARPTGRGVGKIFEERNITIPEAIKAQVEVKYNKIVGDSTVRGNGRKAIIAACLFHAYKEFGEYRTTDYIRSLFRLTKKKMSGGLSKYYNTFPEARILHTKPENLLRWILTLTGVSQEHYRKIVNISRYLENSSRLFKRSTPQSVASATVYFYLCLNPEYKAQLGLSKNKFSEKALLSDITVTKLVREAALISQCIVTM